MEYLLQSQIKDSCKLALPEGLRDLMSDISREVLRARPQNLYQFIADYLAAMLVARETLTIAGHVCKGVCDCSCEPELDDELRNIGLSPEEVDEAKNIIIRYLEKDKVKEESLVAKLLRTNIDQQKIPNIQKAVKAAYKRNLQHKYSDGSSDDVTRAAKNTLEFYWKLGSGKKNGESNEEQGSINAGHQADASSSNSSQYMFKNIVYDGGINDLYVSSNCKPSGSYGIPLVSKQTNNKEQLTKPNNENEHLKVKQKKSDKRQVHIDLGEMTDKNEIVGEIVKDGEEFGDEGCGYIDDEVLYADDESDISITEDIIEE
ncbi:PREDICTED: uncharacterized protein LOC106105004 isoform X2 [Papilio polytes]|uniref:uncharacterized protein LOC106105004 isoform X2 n=1 Tax=Papilio polytes TaxID=76194 RepID=UPI0006763E1E|nr:PREDICTED: uncharacterized protein LOC106105004 isoform X2 [Papilio polytes]